MYFLVEMSVFYLIMNKSDASSDGFLSIVDVFEAT